MVGGAQMNFQKLDLGKLAAAMPGRGSQQGKKSWWYKFTPKLRSHVNGDLASKFLGLALWLHHPTQGRDLISAVMPVCRWVTFLSVLNWILILHLGSAGECSTRLVLPALGTKKCKCTCVPHVWISGWKPLMPIFLHSDHDGRPLFKETPNNLPHCVS